MFVVLEARFGGRRPSLRAISTILKTSSQRRSRASSCGESAGVATTTPSKFLEEYASATRARTEASSSASMAVQQFVSAVSALFSPITTEVAFQNTVGRFDT